MKIDQLIRTPRKTIALIINREGQLIVRAPLKASNAQILAFIQEKSAWIRAKQEAVRQRKDQAVQKQYKAGETFLYLGEPYPLEIVDGAHPAIALKGGKLQLEKTYQPQAEQVLMEWYKQQARNVLEERARLYARRFDLHYNKLRISSARTRWGSCSTLGTLSFTWRLVMAPLPVIDYVVIHELAHIVEKNHSHKFWDRVATMMPDYEQKVKWLKQNGHRLNLE